MNSSTDASSATSSGTAETLGSNPAHGLSSAEAAARLQASGANEIPEPRQHPALRLASKFWGPSAWMLELIAALSVALHKRTDFLIAVILLLVNGALSFVQEGRASAALAALRHRLNVTARVLREARWQSVPARSLVVGDIVRVRGGDFVPADLQLVDGRLRVDQSALTGESRLQDAGTDATLYSGSVVRDGEATGVVVATGLRTYFGKTTQLVAGARPKLHVEAVIGRVVRWLFTIVAVMVAIALLASWAEHLPLLEVFPIALVVLMSAIPVALPVMFTVTMAVGSMELARHGALVTRLSAIEDAATMDMLCADKTGTLTMNRLSLAGISTQPGYSSDDVLAAAAFASNAANEDPIDIAILRAATTHKMSGAAVRTISFVPFSPANRRTEALVEADGRRMRCVKGALHAVARAAGLDSHAVESLEAQAVLKAKQGVRTLAVARADEGEPLRLVGLAHLYDAPRPDSRQLIDELRSLGVRVKMLTGDALPVAREIAKLVGLGSIVSASRVRAGEPAVEGSTAKLIADFDGVAELFPEDKFAIVKNLQAAGHVVGMTGDGVNDAPALRQAEVGIAVSGATDVAKGAASVVLTTEGLGSVVDLVKSGRAIYQRVLTWIVNKISRTIMKAGVVVITFLATGKFVVSVLGMVLLVFLTDFVKVALATDRVHASQQPETWEIAPLVSVAVVLGVLMLMEALALLALGWHLFDLGNEDGHLYTFTFQTLLFFAIFSILSIRERRAFWTSRPSTLLATALGADALLGLVIGATGLGELQPLSLGETGLVFASACILALGPNDYIKTRLMARALAAM
jgi:H+-transporting ATPase